ncbi:MAG: hypothetical protein KKC29_02325 [Alphaproteobacteria bacterium]|jgi:hypothetical protein|nr:hypothetical protein [Alphaproteobacteria bacterium]MBU2041167.1 hypothetical protein [Alphaproteobacteria bacterium]MBU2125528.1 hypothetical protein [Alphaproteobacteria bacterium]MBU2208513.1 hypothetical protein [Alphaproteobacteria bacterium]MBU2289922.1 hypothetical protein [Alphaproteobacteria bacterium]
MTMVGILSAFSILAAQPAADTSGLGLFWNMADRIQAGFVPASTDWDVMFAHPGYAQIERSGQRRGVVQRCMRIVFQPDAEARMRELAEVTNPRTRRTCSHLDRVRERRRELSIMASDPRLQTAVQRGLDYARDYLPSAATGCAAPPVYIILFEDNGFGGESVATDLLSFMERSDEASERLLGHELHHSYLMRTTPPSTAPEADDVVETLRKMTWEGIASRIDKQQFFEPGFDVREPAMSETARQFRDLQTSTPARLAVIDGALAALDVSSPDYAAAAQVIGEQMPLGGHENGYYLAAVIEEEFGRPALAAVANRPIDFFRLYNRAASRRPTRFRFSPAAVNALARMESLSPEDPN